MKMGRHWSALVLLIGLCGGLAYRGLDLHLIDSPFLAQQGEARHLRTIEVVAHRGLMLDRNGRPLAVSTPVSAVWLNPEELDFEQPQWGELGTLLEVSVAGLRDKAERSGQREFLYVKRQVEPEISERIQALGLRGVYSQREYRRYYPMGEITGHLLGFTNIDDQGQEGLELAYDDLLSGKPGEQKIIKDRLGRWVEPVSELIPPQPGRDLRLSIDARLQHFAYQELKNAVHAHQAKFGSLVVMDSGTGEVLAMVNQPAFNPNMRQKSDFATQRNRAVTDLFEPGSTVKPFTLAVALGLGHYRVDSVIDTAPGYFHVGSARIKDVRNYGELSLTGVLQKSSNVGAARVGLEFGAEQLWQIFDRIGFGLSTASGFPGEAGGLLHPPWNWKPIEHATLAFGYGLSVTALQLARAYSVLANGGYLVPIRYLRSEPKAGNPGQRVLSERVALAVTGMLESVIAPEGTGNRAAVPGYRVAGKTGTTRLAAAGGYAEDRYLSIFAGFGPVGRPRLVMVVTIGEPGSGGYYGGQVAAPVFGKVMARAFSVLGMPPDQAANTAAQQDVSRNRQSDPPRGAGVS